MSITNRWLSLLLAFCLLPALVSAASGSGSRTMDYAWLLFLKVNEPPQVDAGNNQGISGDTADLSASVIDDPNDTLTYAWIKVSGPGSVWFDNASSKQTLVTFSASGTYTLKFTADDGEFETSDTVIIAVTNTSPNVSAGGDKQITHPTNSVTLSGSVSDAENNVEGIAWSKISGPGGVSFSNPSAVGTNVTFSSGAVGTYVLRLSASDWEFTGSDTVTIEYLPTLVQKIDTIVTIGDSITDGFGDSDCIYQQAHTSCTGYQRPLKDKLKGTTKYASNLVIWDESWGGTTSGWGRSNIDRITNNYYPSADQYLIMFGTNDANNPPLAPSTFKSNMQYMISTVKSKGAKPALAKAPYAKGDQIYRNYWIQQYNQAVDQLVSSNSINVSPPDFYGYFQSHQYQIHTYYMFNAEAGLPLDNTDNLHPTHDGYQGMVNLWYYKLR